MPSALLYDFVTGREIPLADAGYLAAAGWNGAYQLGALLRPDEKAKALIREHQRILEQRAEPTIRRRR